MSDFTTDKAKNDDELVGSLIIRLSNIFLQLGFLWLFFRKTPIKLLAADFQNVERELSFISWNSIWIWLCYTFFKMCFLLLSSSKKNGTLQELSLHKPNIRTDTCESCCRKNWVLELEGEWNGKEGHLFKYLELWLPRQPEQLPFWGLGQDTKHPSYKNARAEAHNHILHLASQTSRTWEGIPVFPRVEERDKERNMGPCTNSSHHTSWGLMPKPLGGKDCGKGRPK